MRINIKNQLLKKILFVFFIVTLGSCKDSAIFYTISQEEKQLEPLIKGSPTNFVEFNGNVYVGSGTTLYRYNGTMSGNPARGDWSTFTPGRHISQLAVANNTMYALCGDYGNFVLKESSNGFNWTNVSGVPTDIRKIYAANNILFIGTGTDIYYLNGGTFSRLTATDKELNGAAYSSSNYYLSTNGGIYESNNLATPSLIGNGIHFMGIINLPSTIVAISRDGVLYNVTSGAVSPTGHRLNGSSYGNLATGALAIWNNALLLAGRQEEPKNEVNYLHGYQEIDLTLTGNFRDPGNGSPSTVGDNAAYRSNMEKNPVNYLIQAPDGFLFASTQTNGVWSYRERDGKWLWNAEQ